MRNALAKHLTSILRALFFVVPVMLIVNGWVFYRNIQKSQNLEEQVSFRQETVAGTARTLFRLKEVEVYQKTYLLSHSLEDWRTWNRSQWRLKQAVSELKMLMRHDQSLGNVEEQIIALGDDPDVATLKAFLSKMLDFQREVLFARSKDARENREALVVSIVMLTAISVFMLLLTLILWRQDWENQEQAAQSLRESEERMMTILNSSPIIFLTVDAKGICTTSEGQGLEFLKCEPRSFVGKSFIEHFSDRKDVTESMEKALRGEQIKTEIELEGRYFETTFTPAFHDGKVTSVVAIAVDVTERKLREKDTQMANEAKSRFLANMSHEIRTPLGIILGFIDLAMSSETLASEKPKYLLKIRHNAEVLSRLVDDILDLSKVEAGKLDVETIDFSLDALLEDIHENFTMRSNKKGIQFFIEKDLRIPTIIKTDPVRLRQILMNLIGNAVKFTDRGFVRLRVIGRCDSPGIHHLRFTVEDTGLGIDPKNEKRLFIPFSQAEASTARRFGGTGLGLILSRRMAELIHGKLDLVSTAAGRGSVFELSLPVEQGAQKEVVLRPHRESNLSAVSAGMRSSRLQGVSLLLVEDAPDNQMLVKIILEMHGANVTCVSDGRSGVEKISEQNYDVILMDIQMPGMDGFETTQQIKLSGCSSPVVALTAHAMREEREHALKFGFDDYLTKPINRLDLISVVERCAKKGHSRPLADGRETTNSPEITGA